MNERREMEVRGWQCGEKGCGTKRQENGREEKILQRRRNGEESSEINFTNISNPEVHAQIKKSTYEIATFFFRTSHSQIYNPTCILENGEKINTIATLWISWKLLRLVATYLIFRQMAVVSKIF